MPAAPEALVACAEYEPGARVIKTAESLLVVLVNAKAPTAVCAVVMEVSPAHPALDAITVVLLLKTGLS